MKKLIFFLLLFLFFLPIKSARAANTTINNGWYNQPTESWGEKVFGEPAESAFKERYNYSVVGDIGNTFYCWMRGVNGCAPSLSGTGQVGGDNGAIGNLSSLIGVMYKNQPASSVEYLADLGQNLGLAKPAYAQGLGFGALNPILPLWKMFRNIAYLGFVIIFVIVGFMIMFRKRIDPRTVVTIQDALPRLVVALLLITFSYAIAGLFIDGMVLSMRLIDGVFTAPGNDWRTLSSNVSGSNYTFDSLFQQNIFDIVDPLRDTTQIEKGVGQIGGIPPPLTDITVKLVFSVAAFFVMIKLFFMLLTSYIGILIDTIFGPLILLTSALPDNKSLSKWLRGLLSNALVFPVTFAMLYFAILFVDPDRLRDASKPGFFWLINTGKTTTDIVNQTGWAPALLGSGWGKISSLIAFGIFLATPGVASKVKEALEIKPEALAAGATQEITGAAGRIPIIGGLANTLGLR